MPPDLATWSRTQPPKTLPPPPQEATRAAILAELRAFVHEMRAPGPDTDALLEKLEGAVRGLYASVHSVQRMEPPVVADGGVRVA